MVRHSKPLPLRTRPTISVIIPCYNYGSYLPACAASVLTQDGVDTEIVIVDDASPDGSVAIARSLADQDPRIRVLEHQQNQGHIATYNEGLREATGAYVVLLSADDLLARGSLARAAALLECNMDVGFVYGYPPRFTDQPPPARTEVRSWSIWPGNEWLRRICRRGTNLIFCPEVVMRTELMRELIGYDQRLPQSADFHLWLRAAARASVGRVNGCDQAFYRVHGHNMHLEKYAGIIADINERRRAFEFFFAEDGDELPLWRALHGQARRSLASEALLHVRRSYEKPTLTAEQRTALVGFAEETYPQIRGGRLWQSCEDWAARHESGRGLSVSQRARAIFDDLRKRLRWHRWHRYGT